MTRICPWLVAFVLAAAVGCTERGRPQPLAERGRDAGACVDRDGDGRGEHCAAGYDCDDRDPDVAARCDGCSESRAGCVCEPGAPAAPCYLDPSEGSIEGTITCHEGTRYCREGVWSACEDIFTYEKRDLPERAALIDPDAGPITCNACNPTCFRITDNLDPMDGGLGGISDDRVAWNAGGGLTLAEDPDASVVIGPIDAGYFDPSTCMEGTAPDRDCDGIPDEYDPYPDDPPFATANPAIFLDIPPGQTGVGQIDLGFFLNSADVYFLVDQSASMSEERDQLKTDLVSGTFVDASFDCADYDYDFVPNNELKSQGLVGAVRCIIRDSNFGVGFFREIPFDSYANNEQIVFDNYQDITSSVADVQAGIDRLTTVGNYEWPEASMLALNNLVTGDGMYFGIEKRGVPPRYDCPVGTWGYPCFRDDAIPIVIMFTDAMMHNGPSANDYAYNSSKLDMVVGTDREYVPVASTNETFTSARSAADVSTRLLTFTGDTTGMSADVPASDLSCLSQDGGPDAVYQFSLSQQSNVTISSEGSRFDTVLGLFAGTPSEPSILDPADNNNETADPSDVISLNEIVSSAVGISGDTGAMAADFSQLAVGCDADPNAADAVYKFTVGQNNTNVAISTEGSSFDTVLALYDDPPPTNPTPSTNVANDNTDMPSAADLGEVYDGALAVVGDSSAGTIAADFLGAEIGCGADDASKDAVYAFNLDMPTRVEISTEGSSFDTVIALVGNTCGAGVSTTPPVSALEAGGNSSAQSAATHAFAAGAYVIPMDTDFQDDAMLEAYGLIYELLANNVPVSWVIAKNKGSAGADFTVSSTDVRTAAPIDDNTYRGGPFVVDSADAASASTVINAWLAANPSANVHMTTAQFDGYVRKQLIAAPAIALFADGSQGVARGYLQAAGIPDSTGTTNWSDLGPDVHDALSVAGVNLADDNDGVLFDDQGVPAYCQVLSMGWSELAASTALGQAVVAEYRAFLQEPTHLFAQGEAATSIERNANGKFLTDNGYTATSSAEYTEGIGTLGLGSYDLPFMQLDGTFAPDTSGVPHFSLPGADGYKDDNAVMIGDSDSPIGNHDVWVTGHMDGECVISSELCDPGGTQGYAQGKVSYLGGSAYTTSQPISSNPETNGVRLFLNSLFEADCSTDFGEPRVSTQITGPASTLSSEVTYTFAYDNDGPGLAFGATLQYSIPSGATFQSATGGATVSGGVVSWDLGSLDVDEAGSFTVTVDLGSTGIYESYAVLDYRQGMTERRAVTGLLATDYDSGGIECTSLGLIEESVPSSAENTATAYDVEELNGRIYSLSGSTSSMNSDYDGTFMGGGAADSVPDAAFKFTLTRTADVRIDTSGTSFDSVVALYNASVGGITTVLSADPNDTDNAQHVGTVNGTSIQINGGDTDNNTATYDGVNDVSCASDSTAAPDAAYAFHVSAETRVAVSTLGSSFDTVLSLHDGTIVRPSGAHTYGGLTGNETRQTAFEAPVTATGNELEFSGSTAGMRADFRTGSCQYYWDSGGAEAVVKFNVATAGDYTFNLDSSFSHAFSIYSADPFTPTSANTPDWGTTGIHSGSPNQVGRMDDWYFGASGYTDDSSWGSTACGMRTNSGTAFYEFTLDASATLNFNTIGSSIDSAVQVYSWDDPANPVLQGCEQDEGNVTTCYFFGCFTQYYNDVDFDLPLDAGRYVAVVGSDSNNQEGYYQLRITDAGASATSYEVCSEGTTSSNFTQTLVAGDYYAIIKGYASGYEGDYTLSIDGGGGTAGDNNLLECEDGTADGGATSVVERTLPGPQDYYVVVKGAETGESGPYTLTLTDLDTPQVGTRIAYDPDTGSGSTSTIVANELPPGDYYVILGGQTTADHGDYNIEIRDLDAAVGTVVECDDDDGADNSSVIEADLAAGRYYVVVKGDGASDAGAYKLSVRDITRQGYNQVSCDADSGPAQSSYIQETLDIGTYYLVVKGDGASDAGAYDLLVQDTSNNPIGAMACNDDGGSYQTSVIERTLNPGDYYVALKGYDASEAGRYQLTIGGGNEQTIKYVPPTWSTTAANLQAAGAKVIPILSCHDDPYHGDVDGDCNRARAQAQALANATESLGPDLAPLVYDIDRDGSGLSSNVVDGITSLANYLEMDVTVQIAWEPDANPGFIVNVQAIDQPGDGCTGLANGNEHLNCIPGASPRFQISFENPPEPNHVEPNDADPGKGYNFRAQLIADGTFLVDEVPVYIVPLDVNPDNNPPDTPVYGSGEYWQDTGSPGCTDNTRPDWRDLGWNAEVPANTTITFKACAAETQEDLDGCTPTRIATVSGVGSCAVDADCPVGYCDPAVGACQVATAGECADDNQCASNAVCTAGYCTFTSQPVYIGSSLGIQNFQRFLRVAIGLTASDGYAAPPVLHGWEMTYVCNTVD